MIKEFVVTTASLHDSQIDLGIPNFRNKGYSGSGTRGVDAGMERASRKHSLSIHQVRRNRRITRKHPLGEKPYSVIKRIFNGGHVFVIMIRRARVKATFMCIGYNLLTVASMEKDGRIAVALKNY
ncbi:MAG: hypothetical protein M1431_06360 [Candidatus Thermoplasmatota archaeon]|nr:hypothetical protein [Candidatus Thermoplasmatota archaeon]